MKGTWQTTSSSSGKGVLVLVLGVVAVAAALTAGAGATVAAAVTELLVWLAIALGVVVIAAVTGSVLFLRRQKTRDAIAAAQRETRRLEYTVAQETRRLERAVAEAARDELAHRRALEIAALSAPKIEVAAPQVHVFVDPFAAALSGAQPQPVKVIPMQLERNQP